jgi:hypothetical protein
MGLFDKIKAAGATALGALKAVGSKVVSKLPAPVMGALTRVAPVLGAAAKIVSPVAKVATAISIGSAVYKGVTALKSKSTSQKVLGTASGIVAAKSAASIINYNPQQAAASGGAALAAASKSGIVSNVVDYAKKHPIVTSVGVVLGTAGAIYGAEKLAEAAGVRGGAGFIGRRPTKKRKKAKKTKKRYATTRR